LAKPHYFSRSQWQRRQNDSATTRHIKEKKKNMKKKNTGDMTEN